MQTFEQRRDRYDLFNQMESPALNLCFPLELPDLRPWCKAQGLAPFHVLLYAVLNATLKVENFRYRVLDGEVIRIDRLTPSFTVMNRHHDLNFAQFEWSDDVREFVARSQAARDHASALNALNAGYSATNSRHWKEQVFITCIPWLAFTAIQHPMAVFASPDIPAISWGKFRDLGGGRVEVPFSVQAHHGFVDGYHVHLLAEQIAEELHALMR